MKISLRRFDRGECKELIECAVGQYLKDPEQNESLHIFVEDTEKDE